MAETHGATPKEALEAAIAQAGGQGKLARVCGCTQGAVWQMLNKPEPMLSPQFVLAVEQATGIPRWELRPDLYPPTLEAGPAATRQAQLASAEAR